MKLFTRQMEARRLMEHVHGAEGFKVHQKLREKLLVLDVAASPDAVDEAFREAFDAPRALRTWQHCNECEQFVEAIVQLGEPPDYESSTASVCVSCLTEALKLANEGG